MWIKSFGFLPVIDKLASSANNEVEKIFEMFGKSLMYIRKRIGPNTLLHSCTYGGWVGEMITDVCLL